MLNVHHIASKDIPIINMIVLKEEWMHCSLNDSTTTLMCDYGNKYH